MTDNYPIQYYYYIWSYKQIYIALLWLKIFLRPDLKNFFYVNL